MAAPSFRRCLQAALRMLGRRDHGVEEMRRRLEGKGFSATAVDATIAECIRLDYLNDERFAAMVVLNGQRQGYGPGRITQKLKAKGIDGDLSERMLAQHFDAARQVATCREVLEKKMRNFSAAPEDTAKYKAGLFRFLYGRGFSVDTIRQVLPMQMD